ncbi:MAG: hypothetical protein HQ495_04975, partial [Alphaproteobacteria bacterium]|nr:hypothetical protein [Alphaproteobacteria bacterium]
VILDAPDLPDGLDLGDQVIDVLPTNRSGVRIVVGTGAVVFAIGTLQTSDRLPVSLQAGRLRSVAEPEAEPKVLVTNRRGRFIVEGLKPGQYELRMLVAPDTVIPIDIPQDARGRYDLGPVILPTDGPPVASFKGDRP